MQALIRPLLTLVCTYKTAASLLMLEKKNTVKETWDALVAEMTKKLKMVVTS